MNWKCFVNQTCLCRVAHMKSISGCACVCVWVCDWRLRDAVCEMKCKMNIHLHIDMGLVEYFDLHDYKWSFILNDIYKHKDHVKIKEKRIEILRLFHSKIFGFGCQRNHSGVIDIFFTFICSVYDSMMLINYKLIPCETAWVLCFAKATNTYTLCLVMLDGNFSHTECAQVQKYLNWDSFGYKCHRFESNIDACRYLVQLLIDIELLWIYSFGLA